MTAYCLIAAFLFLFVPNGQQQAQPVFHAGVDLVTINVQITPAGKASGPMRRLTPADFDITVSGKKRAATSVTFLHYDTGPVRHSFPIPPPGASPACPFGFLRQVDKPTAHYFVGVKATDADRTQVKKVRIKIIDKAFAIQRFVWRSPIRRGGGHAVWDRPPA